MNNADVEIIKQQILYKGIFQLYHYQLRHRLFNGEWSAVIARELVERYSAVAILPYDPVLDKVVLIEQFRVGPLPSGKNPWLIEIVAGVIDTAESPEAIAKREAMEEAGCVILKLLPLYDFFVSPGGSSEYLHMFCGIVDASHITGTYGLEEEGEDIRAYTLSSAEAFAKLAAGEIKTTPAIIALQWLQLNLATLKP